jgi:putative transcriptional regulator
MAEPVAEQRLTGSLLVATPLIGEGIFERAVILVVDHSDDGAFGVILNQPSEIPVEEILPTWGEAMSEPAVIYQGGPVGDDRLGHVTHATLIR